MTMSGFQQLRAQASAQLASDINRARREYRATIAGIRALESAMSKPVAPSRNLTTVIACVRKVVPPDRPFTALDIMAALEAYDRKRRWTKAAIDNAITRLRERGMIRR